MTNEDIRPTVRISINHTVRAKMLLIKCTAGSQVLIQEFLVHIEKISLTYCRIQFVNSKIMRLDFYHEPGKER